MDNSYKEDMINIIDTLKELVIKELNTDLSQQEYNSLYTYCSGFHKEGRVCLESLTRPVRRRIPGAGKSPLEMGLVGVLSME